jgi:hypothetical protein
MSGSSDFIGAPFACLMPIGMNVITSETLKDRSKYHLYCKCILCLNTFLLSASRHDFTTENLIRQNKNVMVHLSVRMQFTRIYTA